MMSLRIPFAVALLVVATLTLNGAWSVATGESTGSADSNVSIRNSGGGDEEQVANRVVIREGTHIQDRRGRFELTGDSAVFIADDGSQFGGLKNLNLQRVIQTLRATSESDVLNWTVSGDVTEYLGRNFILITRVVRRSSSPAASTAAN